MVAAHSPPILMIQIDEWKKYNYMKTNFFLRTFFTSLLLCLSVTFIKAQTTIWVTSNGDAVPSVPGQLRYAIDQANANPSVVTTIKFNIPVIGTNPVTIQLTSELPQIAYAAVNIDGTTQTGYAFGSPKIIIDGSKGSPTQSNWIQTGIYIYKYNDVPSQIKGIQIQNFNTGLYIFAKSFSVTENKIIGCVTRCINLDRSVSCTIKKNYINGDPGGTTYSPAPVNGIEISNSDGASPNNIIGGVGSCGDEGNIIGRTTGAAIDNTTWAQYSYQNKYSGNIIYGYQTKGIDLRGAANNNIAKPVITSAGCTTSGTSLPNATIELYGRRDNSYSTADVYITSVTANASGVWTASLSYIKYSFITATQTDVNNNTSELATGVAITPTSYSYAGPEVQYICVNDSIQTLNITGFTGCSGTTLLWNFGDGTATSTSSWHQFTSVGTYIVSLYAVKAGLCNLKITDRRVVVRPCISCENCIGSFAPEAGSYFISAWVKKEVTAPTDISYAEPQITITFPSSAFPPAGTFSATDDIIDGWQRIYKPFDIPAGATYIKISLSCSSGNCLFDDIRIYPADGTVKSYVYDPTTMRLMAELDERNYATFYEYDEEGKLIRVKKETEKGIMTIKENKDNTNKR